MRARSRVIHASIDPSVPVTTRKAIGDTSQGDAKESNDGTAGESTDQVKGAAAAAEDEEEEGGTDPDRAITNAREARPEDGLFTTADLRELYQKASAPARSTYDEAQKLAKAVATCGQRLELSNDRLGYDEPEWTSYTHYWKTVLGQSVSMIDRYNYFMSAVTDYIFVLDPVTGDAKAQVLGYLKPPSTEQLGLGIPMKGITSSDHVSLTVELAWSHSYHD
jgi:RNA exonuclease NGL2